MSDSACSRIRLSLPASYLGVSSSAASGGLLRRPSRPILPRAGSSAAYCTNESDPHWLLFCRPGSLATALGVPYWICDCAGRPREATRGRAGGRAGSIGKGGRQCGGLAPTSFVLWKYGFFEINSTIVTTWGLMLVMVVGSKLVTHKLLTEGRISRWQGFLEIVVTTIEKQIEGVGLRSSREISRLPWHIVPVHRDVEPLRDHSWVRTADGFALDHVRAGALSLCRGADFRHSRSKDSAVTSGLT